MGLISFLKGVWKRMISPSTIQEVLKVTPAISQEMQENITLWEQMYTGKSPWLDENVRSLGIASEIASEKARMATLEMQVKMTGESERAKYLEKPFMNVIGRIRNELEYGIALGGFVIRPYVVKGVDDKYVIKTTFATVGNFFPIGFNEENEIVDAGFIDRITTKEFIYTKIERQQLKGTTLTIYNYAFKKDANTEGFHNDNELGYSIPLDSVDEWKELETEVILENVEDTMFAYFKMPQANNIDINSPLGVSGFSRAVKLIEDCDKQYSNFLWEFEGGQMAVDVDRTALNPEGNKNGKDVYVLPKLQDRLFRRTLDLGEDDAYHVFAPTLRDKSILNGLNNILIQIENACDLSRGTLSAVNFTEARTATELKILKQRSYAANADIQKELQKALERTLEIMSNLCDLYDIVPEGKYEVAYCWDDSIIIDKDAERQIDLIDVEKGLMSRIQYRIKWYGETEEQARQAIKLIDEEKKAELEMNAQFMQKANPANQSPLQRANESNKVTDLDKK